MKNSLTGTGKSIAIFLAVIFVVTLVSSFFLYSFENNAFDAETYKTALLEKEVYKRIPATLGEQLALIANGNGAGLTEDDMSAKLSVFRNLTAQDWEIFISELLTTEDLQAMSEANIDSIFNYLNGNASSASISFVVLKESLEGERGVNAVLALLNAQPACSLQQIAEMATSAFNGNGLLFCNPPALALEIAKPLIQAQLGALNYSIPPEKIYLSRENTNQVLVQTQARRFLMHLSPLVPLFLLSAMTMLAVRSTKSWLQWWGLPLLISGGIGLLLTLGTKPLMQSIFEARILKAIPNGVSPDLLALAYDLLDAITHAFTQQSALLASYSALAGLLMLIGAFVLGQVQKSGA
jgi:hypothetical protein